MKVTGSGPVANSHKRDKANHGPQGQKEEEGEEEEEEEEKEEEEERKSN
jgi:ribosomal protein L12E/L44/L45/RPP1/RPP2